MSGILKMVQIYSQVTQVHVDHNVKPGAKYTIKMIIMLICKVIGCK